MMMMIFKLLLLVVLLLNLLASSSKNNKTKKYYQYSKYNDDMLPIGGRVLVLVPGKSALVEGENLWWSHFLHSSAFCFLTFVSRE